MIKWIEIENTWVGLVLLHVRPSDSAYYTMEAFEHNGVSNSSAILHKCYCLKDNGLFS
jgi:hypothetical protein